MIIVRLEGGLGNQLFQYSTGRRLAQIHGTEIKVDTSLLDSASSIRSYQLGHYNIVAGLAKSEEIRRYIKTPGIAGRLLYRFIPAVRPKGLITEKHFHFDPALLAVPDNTYLCGYWQSAKYFRDIRGILLRELTPKLPPSGKNADILREIRGCMSVAVHIRRGDYVSNPQTNRFHGICTKEYYAEAISRASALAGRLHFYVFSDEPEWASANLEVRHPVTFVSHNRTNGAYEDLRLMSACKHFVIANSSFSWWGAWLSEHPEKVVIAPARWFNDSPHDTRDLLPEEWKRI